MRLSKLRTDIQVKLQFDDMDLITLNNALPILRDDPLSGNRPLGGEAGYLCFINCMRVCG